jgi:hypothetical protein
MNLHSEKQVMSSLPSESGDDIMSSYQVAAWLHVKRNTVSLWRFQGSGPTYLKFGNRVFYRRRDVEAWLSTRERKSTMQHRQEQNKPPLTATPTN